MQLSCENMNELTWFVDGSYTLHDDMKGQSGAELMTGKCAVIFKSSKQKVNTTSSTETELIAVDDALPTIQWAENYMANQGYDLETIKKKII